MSTKQPATDPQKESSGVATATGGGAPAPPSETHPQPRTRATSAPPPENSDRRRVVLSVVITLAACALIYGHVRYPDLKVDAATITLFVIAVLPWLTPFFRALRPYVKSAEIAGLGKLELWQEVQPAAGGRAPAGTKDEEAAKRLNRTPENSLAALREDVLPHDYYYLNHSSRLKEEVQASARAATKVDLPHYNIRVIVDSYYQGAMDRVARVEYVLHTSYPEPYRIHYNREKKFLLKEWANGEYVLMAKVYLRDRAEPVILQRYVTLWKDGPLIP